MNPAPRRLNIRAIVVGVLAAIGATFVATFALVFIAATILGSRGLTAQQMLPQLQEVERTHPVFMLASLGCIGVGGYVAAARAPRAELRHAMATGCFALGLNLPVVLFHGPQLSTSNWVELGLTPLAALLGGYWWLYSRPSDDANRPDPPPPRNPPESAR